MKKNNLLIIFGVGILILLIVALVQVFRNDEVANIIPSYGVNQGNNNQNTQPEEDVFVVPTPSNPEQIVVQSTGGKATPMTAEESTAVDQFRALRLRLPLEADNFSLSKFNFDTFKITVTYKDTFIGNKSQTLKLWLNDNGYGNVQETYFEIK